MEATACFDTVLAGIEADLATAGLTYAPGEHLFRRQTEGGEQRIVMELSVKGGSGTEELLIQPQVAIFVPSLQPVIDELVAHSPELAHMKEDGGCVIWSPAGYVTAEQSYATWTGKGVRALQRKGREFCLRIARACVPFLDQYRGIPDYLAGYEQGDDRIRLPMPNFLVVLAAAYSHAGRPASGVHALEREIGGKLRLQRVFAGVLDRLRRRIPSSSA